jgi:hypothetical protein
LHVLAFEHVQRQFTIKHTRYKGPDHTPPNELVYDYSKWSNQDSINLVGAKDYMFADGVRRRILATGAAPAYNDGTLRDHEDEPPAYNPGMARNTAIKNGYTVYVHDDRTLNTTDSSSTLIHGN